MKLRAMSISRVSIIPVVFILLVVSVTIGENARHNGESSSGISIDSAISGFARFLDRRNRRMIAGRRGGGGRDEYKPKVCFDLVGCFADPPPALSLKRPPEHPSVIQTRFLLYTRGELEQPEVIQYGDGLRSIGKSHFNATKKLKVIIHGYKGSGNDLGGILGAKSLLQLEDANVIILDWTKGAGTTYQSAVANTELVGRQLALVLLDAMNLGTKAEDVHVVGFSLGAHVAGCASEVLKKKKLLLGRITGLDPASPFFRHHVFRERSRKLDVTDARLVDVVHTDGSEAFTDGFGLLKPMGHVDFFPNGGRQQPGCTDIKNSVVYSHFHEDILDHKIACSHLRAWQIFMESVRSQQMPDECKFRAWPCSEGSDSYARGKCFPRLETVKWKSQQEMGYRADRGPLGIYYLPTRSESPFCGDPLRAGVVTSEDAPRTSGTLFLRIKHPNSTTTFSIRCEIRRLTERKEAARTIFYHIAAAAFKTVTENLESIEGSVWYEVDITDDPEEGTSAAAASSNLLPRAQTLQFDKMFIEDRRGNRWEFCRAKMTVGRDENNLVFRNRACTIN